MLLYTRGLKERQRKEENKGRVHLDMGRLWLRSRLRVLASKGKTVLFDAPLLAFTQHLKITRLQPGYTGCRDSNSSAESNAATLGDRLSTKRPSVIWAGLHGAKRRAKPMSLLQLVIPIQDKGRADRVTREDIWTNDANSIKGF